MIVDAGRLALSIRHLIDGASAINSSTLSDEFIAKVDRWASKQVGQPGRSEAIRRLVELGLKAKGK